MFDKSLSDMNVLGSSQLQSPVYSSNILDNIHENQVQEMKRVTDEYRESVKKSECFKRSVTDRLELLRLN